MLISCNKLKKYIKESETIDFEKVWDLFTIRTAEVEDVKKVGNSFDNVVVAKILSCEEHPDSDHMHVLSVDVGESEPLQIVCGAPNVRVGLKTALIKVGGHIEDIEITPRKLRGIMSYGMCCSGRELSISEDASGILELPDSWEVGKDIKEYLPIEDIIVEIDNKSLTNRPDLWGHYGIAREVAAITGHELLPLEIEEIENNKEDLEISIKDPNLCYRYCGLTIDYITNNKTPLDMQIFLYYAGMRSINLMVDLTNYLMLELGQPMHAFDKRVVESIEVGLANDGDEYTTLDGEQRKLTKDNLMIKNGDDYFAIAGVMGGLDSEILEDTDSIFLESACFNAGSVRKTAAALGLRTEASARYEKSLDPNMCDFAIKRLVYLLRKENPDMEISSNLTDVYPTKLEEGHITLSKSTLKTYMGRVLPDEDVKKYLENIGFKVDVKDDVYEVVVPTFRHSKDINIPEDLIEEICRFYGLENLVGEPLKLNLEPSSKENVYNEEYKVKYFLANKYNTHEVHSYIWYNTKMLKELGIEKDGIKLLAKNEDNILRDDLSLSLMNIVNENFKNYSKFNIFEIGTVIKNKLNKRYLSIILADDEAAIASSYLKAKEIIKSLFINLKNINVSLVKGSCEKYYDAAKTKDIIAGDIVIGTINVLNKSMTSKISKKKSIICIDVDFDKYVELEKESILAKEVSKYPEVELDYTVIAPNNEKYEVIEDAIKSYDNKYIKNYKLVDVYKDDKGIKYTIRFTIGSIEKTLNQEDLNEFKNKFIELVKENSLNIQE